MFPTDCSICFLDYDSEEHKIMIGSCGHSLCLDCQMNLASNTCPFCNLPGSFTNAVPNFLAMEMLNNLPTVSDIEENQEQPANNEAPPTIGDSQEVVDHLLAQLFAREEFIILQNNVIEQLTNSMKDQDDQLEDRKLMVEVLCNQLKEKHDDLKANEKSKKWKLFGRKKDKTPSSTFFT